MSAWTQVHPTQPMTAPGGEVVEVDVEMVPLMAEVWRLGFTTLVCCQDAGEAVLGGGTRTPPDERSSVAARNSSRAWLMVLADEAPRLLAALQPLSAHGEWTARPVSREGPLEWVSITFPRTSIDEAAELLRAAAG